jgi:hypothetical protein
MSQTWTAEGTNASTTEGGTTHTLTYDLNAGQQGTKLALLTQEAVQGSALGQGLSRDDGAHFRYSHYVSAISAGEVSALDISAAGFASIDGKFTNSGGTAKDDYGTDDNEIYLTDTGTFQSENDAANVWAGGQIFITDGNGEGHAYRIREHPQPEVEPANAGTILFKLHDKLVAAINSEASAAVIGHPYKNLAIANNGTDDLVTGIAVRDITAAYYAWTQTWGWANVKLDETAGTVAAGTNATLSDSVNGAAQPLYTAANNSETDLALRNFSEPILGIFGFAGVDTEFGPVHLQLQGS